MYVPRFQNRDRALLDHLMQSSQGSLVLPDAEAEIEALLGRRSLPESQEALSPLPTESAVSQTIKIMGGWFDKLKEESRPAPKSLHAVLSSLRPLTSTTADPTHVSKTLPVGRGQRYRLQQIDTPGPVPPSPATHGQRAHFHKSLLIKRHEEEQKNSHQHVLPLVSNSLPDLTLLPTSQPPPGSKDFKPEVSLPLFGLLSETLEDTGPRLLALHLSNHNVIRSRPPLPTVDEDASTRGTIERSPDPPGNCEEEEEEEEEGTEALLSYLLVKFTRARQRRLMRKMISHWLWFSDRLRSERRRVDLESPDPFYLNHSNPLFSSHLLPLPPPSSPPLYGEMRSLLMQMEKAANNTESIFDPGHNLPPQPLPPRPAKAVTSTAQGDKESKATDLEARIKVLEEMLQKKNSLDAALEPLQKPQVIQEKKAKADTLKTPSLKQPPFSMKRNRRPSPQIDLKRLEVEEKRVEDELMAIERDLIRKRGRALSHPHE